MLTPTASTPFVLHGLFSPKSSLFPPSEMALNATEKPKTRDSYG